MDTTGASSPSGAAEVTRLRERIDAIDAQLIELWQERQETSAAVGHARREGGGPRLVLAREAAILTKFGEKLGNDGVELAMLILKSCRGPL